MSTTGTFFKQFYLSARAYLLLGFVVACFLFIWLYNAPILPGKIALGIVVLLIVVDTIGLFRIARPIAAKREMADRFSNGDNNAITLHLQSRMNFISHLEIIEELPEQLQMRKNWVSLKLAPLQKQHISYRLLPTQRGSYHFGETIIFIASRLKLVRRRWVCPNAQTIKVYPSFHYLRQQRLIAQPLQINEPGNRKIRKIGHSLEFEQIKEYVSGDDRRTINWRATARKNQLMVNHYTDEKSQQVYAIVDKGRLMKMPFEGLTLLDYAINASLALCNICLHRQDRFGLITFSHEHGTVLAADRKPMQLSHTLEALYKQDTAFLESDFERLYLQIRTHIRHRSLLILFTNFESTTGLRRQMPYLKQMAKHHLILVIIFENTELIDLAAKPIDNVEDVYRKTIAEKFLHDKRLMVRELQQQGIMAMLSTPQQTTINAINKYVEIKSRQAL